MQVTMNVPTSVFYQMTLRNDTAYEKTLREQDLFDLLAQEVRVYAYV